MLSMAVLAAAASSVLGALSPARNPCKIRTDAAHFRFNPYGAKVIPSPLRMCPPTPTAARVPTPEDVPVARTPAKKAPSVRYALISFKQEQAVFLAPFRISAGDHVVVEGDRGERMGVVAAVTTNAPEEPVSRVLRRCKADEIATLEAQRTKEAAALRKCRELASSLGVVGSRNGAKVHDAEFQSDMSKITIYFSRPSPSAFVDFRKLQRGLFREFRCRIWLAYMDEVEEANAAAGAIFA